MPQSLVVADPRVGEELGEMSMGCCLDRLCVVPFPGVEGIPLLIQRPGEKNFFPLHLMRAGVPQSWLCPFELRRTTVASAGRLVLVSGSLLPAGVPVVSEMEVDLRQGLAVPRLRRRPLIRGRV